MKSESLKRFVLTAVIIMLTGGICFAVNDKGFQYWSTAGAEFNINKDWKVTFEEEFRFGNGGGNLYYKHSDLGFVYSGLAKWIDIGLNYRQVFEKDSKNEWKQENRPHLNITLKGKIYDCDISSRSRFEYRDREDKADIWRYRNKFTLKLPVQLTALKLQPYVADEIFVNFDKEDFNRNRLYFGFSLKLTKNIKCDIFYLWQASRSSEEWKDIDVLGTQLRFLF